MDIKLSIVIVLMSFFLQVKAQEKKVNSNKINKDSLFIEGLVFGECDTYLSDAKIKFKNKLLTTTNLLGKFKLDVNKIFKDEDKALLTFSLKNYCNREILIHKDSIKKKYEVRLTEILDKKLREIKGTVFNEYLEPMMSNITIKVKDTKLSLKTKENGSFRVNTAKLFKIAEEIILIFDVDGFQTEKIVLNNKNTFENCVDVVLKEIDWEYIPYKPPFWKRVQSRIKKIKSTLKYTFSKPIISLAKLNEINCDFDDNINLNDFYLSKEIRKNISKGKYKGKHNDSIVTEITKFYDGDFMKVIKNKNTNIIKTLIYNKEGQLKKSYFSCSDYLEIGKERHYNEEGEVVKVKNNRDRKNFPICFKQAEAIFDKLKKTKGTIILSKEYLEKNGKIVYIWYGYESGRYEYKINAKTGKKIYEGKVLYTCGWSHQGSYRRRMKKKKE